MEYLAIFSFDETIEMKSSRLSTYLNEKLRRCHKTTELGMGVGSAFSEKHFSKHRSPQMNILLRKVCILPLLKHYTWPLKETMGRLLRVRFLHGDNKAVENFWILLLLKCLKGPLRNYRLRKIFTEHFDHLQIKVSFMK